MPTQAGIRRRAWTRWNGTGRLLVCWEFKLRHRRALSLSLLPFFSLRLFVKAYVSLVCVSFTFLWFLLVFVSRVLGSFLLCVQLAQLPRRRIQPVGKRFPAKPACGGSFSTGCSGIAKAIVIYKMHIINVITCVPACLRHLACVLRQRDV